jgi:hypothetical protein
MCGYHMAWESQGRDVFVAREREMWSRGVQVECLRERGQ